MNADFDLKNILLIIAGITSLILGSLILLRNKKGRINIWFSSVVLSTAFWTFSMLFYRLSVLNTIIWARILYLSAALIPIFFLYFTFVFPQDEHRLKTWQKYLLPIPLIFVALLSLWPDMLIHKINMMPGKESTIIFNQTLHIFYGLYICVYFIWAYINLIRKYLASSGVLKIQIKFILAGTLISTLIGVTTNLIMPLLGNFSLNWLGQIAIMTLVIFTTYAIFKHHLMNIKIIATELFSAILIIILFVKFLLSESLQQFILNGIIMAAFLGFSYLLIKSVLKEVKTREEMEELAKELKEANVRLKKLDEAKSEFITIASHQLRSPITAIKGYSSMMLEGSFGRVPIRAKKMLKRVLQSTNRLMFLIDDFLNLSQIERGKMQYNFEKTDLKEMVSEIVDEFKTIAAREKKDIEVSLKIAETEDFIAMVDSNKIQQVFNNLIDNAIKYTEKGFVKINLYADDENGRIFFEVLDSGIGMGKETEALIFQKFTRAGENIFQVHTEGLGLGLYVSKEIIKAHNGKIYAKSDGPGKGSTFFVELPRGDVNPPNTSPEHDYQKHDKRIEEFIKKI